MVGSAESIYSDLVLLIFVAVELKAMIISSRSKTIAAMIAAAIAANKMAYSTELIPFLLMRSFIKVFSIVCYFMTSSRTACRRNFAVKETVSSYTCMEI
jgi:hypothetical protein